MYKIQTLNKISKAGLSIFDDKYTCGDEVENPDGIILRSAKMHDMELPDSLHAIARAGAGVNNIPIDRCSEKGIVVFNTPGANANAVKELVIAGLLLASRKVLQGAEWAQTLAGEGDAVPQLVEKGKSGFAGPEIEGKTLGVIGLGAIGVLVANAAHHLGMNVIGYDPYLSVKAAWNMTRSAERANSLQTVLANSDYVTVHVPATDETKGMFRTETFAQMKKGARLLNFARGELVNTQDVIKAVEEGTLSAYVTDFANEALLGKENIIVLPHLGASTPESEENCAVMAAQEIKDFLENGNIKNSVNFPNCDLGVVTGSRVAVAHKNIPSMLTQISNVFSDKNVNIDHMLNKSKKDNAYTLIDMETEVPDLESAVAEEIRKIDGVIKVMVF